MYVCACETGFLPGTGGYQNASTIPIFLVAYLGSDRSLNAIPTLLVSHQPNTHVAVAMTCARAVFRCFKVVERCADRVTGAAGPYFVALAVVLITLGAICFCRSPIACASVT